MGSITSGISIYPSGYDLNASGTTMVFVSDEVRDVFTGNVVSSGDTIVGVNVNTGYLSIDKIQRTLGINPQGGYSSVADRILAVETVSGASAFVHKSGDFMSGTLTLINGAGISTASITSPSGLNWSGAGAFTLFNAGNVTLSGQAIQLISSGSTVFDFGSSLTIRGPVGPTNVIAVTSGSVTTYQTLLPSGSVNIGSATNPFNIIYANAISGNASVVGSGSFLPLTGGVISGTIIMSGNSAILPSTDGVGFVGTLGQRFAQIWVNTIRTSVLANNGAAINVSDPISLSADISATSSGTYAIGTSNFPLSGVVAKNLFANSLTLSGTLLDPSTLVTTSGATMTGSITLASGASILNGISGVNSLGSQAAPFSNVWTNAVNGNSAVKFKFNELLNPVSPSGYTFANSPSGAMVVDVATVAGVTNTMRFLTPSTHYTISGNSLTLTALFTASGSLFSPMYIY